MDTRIVVIFAPPGKRKETQYFLQKVVPDAEIHDIETQLNTKFGHSDIKGLIGSKTRKFLKDEWSKVVERIIDNISSSSTLKSKLNILIGHSIYYNGNTRELFPLFDASVLKEKLKSKGYVSHVIYLIDDVFDAFFDLNKPGQLFSQRQLSIFLKLYAKSIGTEYTQLDQNPQAYTNWISHCVNFLLNWRSSEMVLIQNIAIQLNSKFMLWGLKQDLDVLGKWITNHESKIFYISHPISEPRSNVTKPDDWPSLVDFINKIQTELKNHKLYTVMPTAIDEYRLAKMNKNYTAKLKLRWPVPPNVQSLLCDSTSKLIDDDVDKTDILHPYDIKINPNNVDKVKLGDIPPIQEFLNGVYSSLDMRIEYEIGNRDHLLVWSTEGIIVIEPYKIADKSISGGVKMELEYIQNVNNTLKSSIATPSLSDLRKLCAIFSKKSVEAIMQNSSFTGKIMPRLRGIIKAKYNLTQSTVDQLIQDTGKLIDDVTSLGTSLEDGVFQDIENKYSDYKKQALIEQFISTSLTLEPENIEYVMILILDNIEEILTNTQNITEIKEFLINSKNKNWQDKLLEIAIIKQVIGY